MLTVAAAASLALWPFASARAHDAQPPSVSDPPHHRAPAEDAGSHVHAPVPPEYRAAHVPAAAWTSKRMLARGKEIYATRCAVCHGEQGDGNGPAASGLPLKPANFRDSRMVGEMAGNYWFWRVSEGGVVEPFTSMGSVMPAWKQALSVEDRWAVIAYTHRFSGHDGPHVVSEHPQLLTAGQGGLAPGAARTDATPGSHDSGHGSGGGHRH